MAAGKRCRWDLHGLVLVRSDMEGVITERGEGVAVYINEKWCSQVSINEEYCDKNIEYMVVSCRPFYLPREFGKIILFIVYIPTDAEASVAADILGNCVAKYENKWPGSARLFMGDSNGWDFQEKIPTYKQYVKSPTRENNTLDKLHCNMRNSCLTYQRSQLGNSDHNMIFCAPLYK